MEGSHCRLQEDYFKASNNSGKKLLIYIQEIYSTIVKDELHSQQQGEDDMAS